jgi:hypothetical protein
MEKNAAALNRASCEAGAIGQDGAIHAEEANGLATGALGWSGLDAIANKSFRGIGLEAKTDGEFASIIELKRTAMSRRAGVGP